MDNIKNLCMIMSGGVGERFWPLSRRKRPKQLLNLMGDKKNLLEKTIERFDGIIPQEDIFIITARHLYGPILRLQKVFNIPVENIFAEPYKKNTTGCLVYAVALALSRFDDPRGVVIGAFPSDHIIANGPGFKSTIKTAYDAAGRYPIIVTIGIKPDKPETGYGYIEIPKKPAPFNLGGGQDMYWVVKFREKPSKKLAEEFIKSGRFFWNSGMFFFNAKTFLNEFEWANPRIYKITLMLAEALKRKNTSLFKKLFYKLDDISIDYSLLEKARHIMMVKGSFKWNDLGNWAAIETFHRLTSDGNINIGNSVLIDVQNSIIYNDVGSKKMGVCAIGLNNTVVVVCKDAVLIAPKDRAQDVKIAVQQMKRIGFRHI